jgi:hypothetical protein
MNENQKSPNKALQGTSGHGGFSKFNLAGKAPV